MRKDTISWVVVMTPMDEDRKKVSRRRFVKIAGAFAVVGIAGAALGYSGDISLGPKPAKPQNVVTSSSTDVTTAQSITVNPLATTQTNTQTATKTTSQAISTGTGSLSTSPLPSKNAFSIFWITDTQFLSESNPALYRIMTKWIADNWAAYNGKIVIHTGDVVQTGAHQVEWDNANSAMSTLLDNYIPYSWCAGNHDDYVGGESNSGWMGDKWAPAFNPSTVKNTVNATDYAQWVGDYHEGMNTAMKFSANGLNFLVINVEWNGGADVLKWVGSILDDPAHVDHNVIVAPHAYMDAWGSTNDARWGPTLADFRKGLTALLDGHSSNVFLTLNGHFATDQGYNTTKVINYRNQLMFDRQDCTDKPNSLKGRGVDDISSTTPDSDKVGGATVTILTFDADSNQVKARTFDVFTGQWRDDPYEQYTISMFSPHPGSPDHVVPPAESPRLG